MEKLKIALLQMADTGTMQGNLQKGIEFCKKAKRQGADIALFPEMWNNGYCIPEDIAELKELAVPVDGEFVGSFAKLAKELDMAIGVTFLEAHEPLPRNTICLFDRNGKLQYTYAKVHTCDFGDECRLDAGEDFYVAELDTAKGKIKVGSMICYDREFPESARILMLKGAELLLVPNACPMEINRLSQLRGRAYENMLAIATCNYPKDQPDCNGHSTVFDGVAYLPELPGSRDTCILEAGETEGLYLAELDVDMLRRYRESEVHGNAYRHPDKYGLLTEKKSRRRLSGKIIGISAEKGERMGRYLLECCVDSVESAMAAQEGGADRLELCAALVIGGISPGPALFEQVRKYCGLPIRVLLRPRFGDFLYTEQEFDILKKEVMLFREKGAEGVVIGCLKEDGGLDMERMRELIRAAEGMKITLHRAFDVCAEPIRTYEQAGELGIDTILTSGQESSCLAGMPLLQKLSELRRRTGGPQIMAGAGVTPDVIRKFVEETDITSYHMSGKKTIDSKMRYRKEGVPMGLPTMSEYSIWRTDSRGIAEAKRVLQEKENIKDCEGKENG